MALNPKDVWLWLYGTSASVTTHVMERERPGYNVINSNLQEIELSRIDMFRWISQLTINVCFCQTRKKLGLFPYFPFVLSARDISRTSRRFCRLKQNGVSKKKYLPQWDLSALRRIIGAKDNVNRWSLEPSVWRWIAVLCWSAEQLLAFAMSEGNSIWQILRLFYRSRVLRTLSINVFVERLELLSLYIRCVNSGINLSAILARTPQDSQHF